MQVSLVGGQHMGLLVVQVLDAVFHLAQKYIGLCERIGGVLGHEPGAYQALQCAHRRPRAQLGVLAATHHLQQLHGKFDLADSAARQLHIVATLRPSCAAFGCMVADLAVQATQGVKHVVIQVAAKHKRHYHAAQLLRTTRANGLYRRHYPALEPGKTLPLAPLHMEILFERAQRNGRRARVPIGPQCQVHPEHHAVLGGVAHQGINGLDHLGKKLLVGNAATALGIAGGIAVLVIDVDQVNVAGHVEFARTQLAHADDAQLAQIPLHSAGATVLLLQHCIAVLVGLVQRQFGQFGHHPGHLAQRALLIAVQAKQSLHGQLAGHPQGCTDVKSLG